MKKEIARARRISGMAYIERTSRLTLDCGRLKKAWKVPGTAEHGSWTMARFRAERILKEITN